MSEVIDLYMERYEGERGPTWVPIACGTAYECGAFADALRPTALARSAAHPADEGWRAGGAQ